MFRSSTFSDVHGCSTDNATNLKLLSESQNNIGQKLNESEVRYCDLFIPLNLTLSLTT